jgi:hypothetical protein
MALAASFVIVSAAFTPSFAEGAVSEKTFDWIFFAIVFIPFVLGLVQLVKPDWLEPIIRDRNSPSGWDARQNRILERPEPPRAP